MDSGDPYGTIFHAFAQGPESWMSNFIITNISVLTRAAENVLSAIFTGLHLLSRRNTCHRQRLPIRLSYWNICVKNKIYQKIPVNSYTEAQ